jgi:prevent-host-death family protein
LINELINREVAMLKTISATKARIHFGEVMKQAKIAPVIVERDGKAEVVVLSKKAYDQLVAAKKNNELKKRLEDLHTKIRAELTGRKLPDPAEVIRRGREERDEQLQNSLH